MNTERHIEQLSEKLKEINGYTAIKCDYAENEVVLYAPFESWNVKHFKLPKKKVIDIDWLLNKCSKMENAPEYTNLKSVFEKIKVEGHIYYTSFGFSFDCLFKSQEKVMSAVEPIKKQLDTFGIKYTTEFSDAWWVYRFKISKSKETIDIINSL